MADEVNPRQNANKDYTQENSISDYSSLIEKLKNIKKTINLFEKVFFVREV